MSKKLHYVDVYGRKIIMEKTKTEKINFTLYHNEIEETNIRAEFKNISLIVENDSSRIYNIISSLYEYKKNEIFTSENPIRDGRNFMYLLKNGDSYYIIFNHDLANEFRNPFETKVELSDELINKLYSEFLKDDQVLTKRLEH